ncbi:MAG: AzlC family ABC transporter permease [Bulleidia sp.]
MKYGKEFSYAWIQAMPIMISYFFISFGLGIVLQEGGWNWMWGLAMSAFVYTGAFQFVLASFLSTGASILTVLFTALFMNCRQIFYGISFLDAFRKTGKWYPYMIHTLTDETYALFTSLKIPEHLNGHQCMVYMAMFSHLSWIVGTVSGGLFSSMISSSLQGVDFALTAMFITIVMDQWKGVKNHTPALTGFVVSAVLLFVLGADSFLLPSFVITAGILFLEVNHEHA